MLADVAADGSVLWLLLLVRLVVVPCSPIVILALAGRARSRVRRGATRALLALAGALDLAATGLYALATTRAR